MNRITQLRKKVKGLSKTKLAKLCGVSRPTIIALETGQAPRLTLKQIRLLTKNLNCSFEDLFDEQ